MCTAAEPASQGHDSGAGAGSHGARASAMRPAPADTATVSRRLSALALTSAFHPACSRAAPSTASVTGGETSTPPPADHLVDHRCPALDRDAPFPDRLLSAVE